MPPCKQGTQEYIRRYIKYITPWNLDLLGKFMRPEVVCLYSQLSTSEPYPDLLQSTFLKIFVSTGVGIATGYGLNGRGLIPGRSRRFLSTSQRLDQL
jgi:hypothetical protein